MNKSVIASDTSTPPQTLETLAQDPDWQVRQAVAANSNTPWQILEQLAIDFPHEFLHNPAGLLQILAFPEEINTHEWFWGGLLRQASIPSSWWRWLKFNPTCEKFSSILLHVQHAGEITSFLNALNNEDEEILLTLIELTPETLWKAMLNSYEQIMQKRLHRLAQSVREEIREYVACHDQLSCFRHLCRNRAPVKR
jgi:hypothetical protein